MKIAFRMKMPMYLLHKSYDVARIGNPGVLQFGQKAVLGLMSTQMDNRTSKALHFKSPALPVQGTYAGGLIREDDYDAPS